MIVEPSGHQPDADQMDVHQVAAELRLSIGLLVRRLRQAAPTNELTMPESSLVVRLDRGGPTTAAALAKLEQISPQSIAATLGGLEARGLVQRAPDPDDGRRVILSLTAAGQRALQDKRNARVEQLTRALSTGFTPAELETLRMAAPLLERLAQSI